MNSPAAEVSLFEGKSTHLVRKKSRPHLVVLSGIGVALSLQVGCTPRRFTDGVRFAAERQGVSDASTSTVKGSGYLQFDANLRADLDEIIEGTNNQAITDQATEMLREANDLANRQASAEIERMPPEGLQWLAKRYGRSGEDRNSNGFREGLKKRFQEEGKQELEADLSRLRNDREVHQFLIETRRHLRSAPGERGRGARALLAAPFFLPAVIGAEIADAEATQRIMVADFAETVEYRLAGASTDNSPNDPSSLPLPELAALYSPTFLQQIRPEASYDPNDDRFGRINLTGTANDIKVNVDTTQPTVYWAPSQARVGIRRYDQLIYALWYPNRPAMSGGDVQAGKIDGVVVRITLDRHHRPAIYEFVRSCGCYHTLWVAEFVEAAAREEFGPPTEAGRYAVRPETKGRSLFLPTLVRDDGTRPCRPLVFVESGYHMVPDIRPSCPDTPRSDHAEVRTYNLEPYDTLTQLPLGAGTASMFDSDGLVHDAQRMEGLLLAPTGMLSAGQPRQLGTMKIRMDAYDHDDPRLLERNLRLPSTF